MFRNRSTAVASIPASLMFLSAAHGQKPASKVAAAQREVLLKADHSWNGTPYTHYPTGRPQLTMLKLTLAPHSVLLERCGLYRQLWFQQNRHLDGRHGRLAAVPPRLA